MTLTGSDSGKSRWKNFLDVVTEKKQFEYIPSNTLSNDKDYIKMFLPTCNMIVEH